jgi:hypothetical protein
MLVFLRLCKNPMIFENDPTLFFMSVFSNVHLRFCIVVTPYYCGRWLSFFLSMHICGAVYELTIISVLMMAETG